MGASINSLGRTQRTAGADRSLPFFYLGAAVSVAFAVGLWVLSYRDAALFVGIWAPSVLGLANALHGRLILVAAAAASMALSIGLWFFVDKALGLFVGMWVPTILAFAGTMRRS